MHHSLSQIFCAGLAVAMAGCDIMRSAVIVYHHRVVYGNQAGLLVEFSHRITTGLDNFIQSLVSATHRRFGVVYKL